MTTVFSGLAYYAGDIARDLAGLRSEIARARQLRSDRKSGGIAAEHKARLAAGLRAILPALAQALVDAVVTPDAGRYAELLLSERGAAGTCGHCASAESTDEDEAAELLLERGADEDDADEGDPPGRSHRGRRAGRKHRCGQQSAAGRTAEGDDARADRVVRSSAGMRPRPRNDC